MLVLFSFLCCVTDALWARQPDIDINRVKLLSNVAYPEHYTRQEQNSVGYQYKRSNDYTDYSSGYPAPRKTIQSLRDAATSRVSETSQIHQPREDPRLFYQSDSYIEEVNRKNLNREVSAIYPGREVVRAGQGLIAPMMLLRPAYTTKNLCVRCPHDRTLIAKPGSDRVMLQSPPILTCSGQKAPKEVFFYTIHGPKFGSLLKDGAHMIIGRMSYRGKTLKICKMNVHVIVEQCAVPDYLDSHCDQENKLCSFSCRDPTLELHGYAALSCGDHMGWTGWTGNLPVCRARNWCKPPSLPEHGHFSCKGTTIGNNAGFSEGAICHIRCSRGWHWSPRAATVCRRGLWTHELSCLAKRQYRPQTKKMNNY